MNAFVHVVDQGSFAAAAPLLGLTPSALSKLVTRLEQRLGIQLLTRTTRKLALTDEGDLYYRHAVDILNAIEAAEAEVSSASSELTGLVRVNTGTAFGRHKLTPLLPRFLEQYPGIQIDLTVTDRTIDPVAEGVDLVLRSGGLADSSLVARKLGDWHRYVCASPAYLERNGRPQVPGDLLKHNCIIFSRQASLTRWPFTTPEGRNELAVKGDISADNADIMLDLALAGHGVVRMLDMIVGDALQQGQLIPLLQDHHASQPTPLWAVTPPGRQRVPRVRALVDFIVREVSPTKLL